MVQEQEKTFGLQSPSFGRYRHGDKKSRERLLPRSVVVRKYGTKRWPSPTSPRHKYSPEKKARVEDENEDYLEEVRALVALTAPRVAAERRSKFEAYYDDRWIAEGLERSKDPRQFVDSFKRNLENRFPPPRPKVCDRCDGRHLTADCPHFAKDRDDHPDAKRGSNPPRGAMGSVDGGNAYLQEARVVPQPGDGSCLFHSLAYLLDSNHIDASQLRSLLMDWLVEHEDTKIADTPVRDWVKWDSGCSVSSYAKRMRHVGWGGGIEMAAFSHKFSIAVHVYEQLRKDGASASLSSRFQFKRISRFEPKQHARIITLLYRGGVHYDALVSHLPPVEIQSKKKHAPATSSNPSSPLVASSKKIYNTNNNKSQTQQQQLVQQRWRHL